MWWEEWRACEELRGKLVSAMAGVDEAAFQTSLGAETDVLILVLLRVMQVGVSSAGTADRQW